MDIGTISLILIANYIVGDRYAAWASICCIGSIGARDEV